MTSGKKLTFFFERRKNIWKVSWCGRMTDNLRFTNFINIKEWKKVGIFCFVEQVNVVILLKQMHGDKEAVKGELN